MMLTGSETRQLCQALLAAFPENDDLEELLLYQMNVSLNHIINVNAGLEQQMFDLVKWAGEQARINELVSAAVRERPQSPLLKRFAEELAAKEGADPTIGSVASAPLPHSGRVIPGDDGYAWYCNRTQQWEMVEAPAYESFSELVFVPGAFEQGHEYFVKRIKRRLAIDPKTVVEMSWPASYSRPESRGELLEVLATALGMTCPSSPHDALPGQIARTLANRLSQRNIVLVHQTLSMQFEPSVVSYYTEWLPDILRQARALGGSLMCLKCYQPIEWLDVPWFVRLRSALRGAQDVNRGTGRSAAQKLIEDVVEHPTDVLRVRSLPDLHDITDEDLVALCNKWGVTSEARQTDLVAKCSGKRTSSDKLRIADTVLKSILKTGDIHI